ncbi:MAG: hypothetical protein Q7T33_02765 [Dehalococcoidia bacterium]|nr:hypothetical protein [Dehalococcoidia bacterium]
MSSSVSRQTTNHVPEPVARVADLMSTFRPRWSLCGGWAVDAWLGSQTRDHGDLDITVFSDDQRAIFDHLAGWHLIAHDAPLPGDTSEPWDGRLLGLPAHIHAAGPQSAFIEKDLAAGVARSRDGFNLEVVLNDRSGDDWILSHQPRISLPLRNGVRQSPWGLPTVVPGVLLFFKATAYTGTPNYMRPRDRQDFLALKPRLSKEQRNWLREAISVVDAEHPWLSQLSPQPSTNHPEVGQSN